MRGRSAKQGDALVAAKSPDNQSVPQLALLVEVQQGNKPMFRAFPLK